MDKSIVILFVAVLAGIMLTMTKSASIELQIDPKNGNPNPTFNCTGLDGYFADRYRNCHVFYRCLPDGTKWTFTCIEDDQFDDEKVTCVRNGDAYCPEYIPTISESE